MLSAVLAALLVAANIAALWLWWNLRHTRKALAEVRRRFQALKLQVRAVDGRSSASVAKLEAMFDASPLRRLRNLARRRRPNHKDIGLHLPPVDVDFETFRAPLVDGKIRYDRSAPRSDIANHSLRLREAMQGRSGLEWLNAVCIAYLRRKSPHGHHARMLFLRLWSEEGETLALEMSPRWLISSLMTFYDHGETEAQRMSGATGFFLGSMLKIGEVERELMGHGPDALYVRRSAPSPLRSLDGMDGFAVGNADIMRNTLSLACEIATRDAVAGPALFALLLSIREGRTVFTRMDENAVAREGETQPDASVYWSFGDDPRETSFPDLDEGRSGARSL